MSKNRQDTKETQPSLLPATGTPLRSFYYPHSRVPYTGLLVQPDKNNGQPFKPPARTKQEFKAECDINNIIKQYKLTGQIQHINMQAAQGAYLDLPDSADFKQALAMVADAEQSFATLPSKVRERFQNDPAQFLAFMDNPANQEELYTLGLATRPTPKQETPPPSTPDPSNGSK